MTATPTIEATTAEAIVPTFTVAILRDALVRAHRQAPEHGCRLDRAASIVATRSIERFAGQWLVESERKTGSFYLVRQTPFGWDCLCQDYRERRRDCKHILAVRLLALCERLAAQADAEPAAPIPATTLDPDAPIPFTLTPQAEEALSAAEPVPAA